MATFDDIQRALDGPHGDNATLYARTAALVAAADFPDPQDFSSHFLSRFMDRCDELRIPLPHAEIVVQMAGALAGLYAAERFADLPPNPALYGLHGDNVVLGKIRDLLLRQQLKALEPVATLTALSDAIIASLIVIAKELPPLAKGFDPSGTAFPAAATIPLVDLLPGVGATIEKAVQPFSSASANKFGLFRFMRELLDENAKRAAEAKRSSRPIPPSQYDGSPSQVVQAYLKDTPLERVFLEPRIPFEIPDRTRFEHTAIVAGAGWGKTQLLQNIILADLRRPDPPALIILDSTGAMVEAIQKLAVFDGRLKDRILIIDPAHSPALNMFDISSPRFEAYTPDQREDIQTEINALFNYIFASGEYDLTGQMGVAFSYAIQLIFARPNSTVIDLRRLLEETPKGYLQSDFRADIERLGSDAKAFFEHHFFSDSLKTTRASIARRLHGLLAIPAFRRMFTASANGLDLFAEIQKGSIILLNTNANLLKEDGMALFGRYIIVRSLAAAFERSTIPVDKRKPAFLIIDEAAPYFDATFEALLTRVRQFRLGVVIAFQHLEQTPEKLRSALAANTSIKYAARLGYADRRWMAREMETEPEFIQSQQKDARDPPQWSQFACHVLGYTKSAVSLTVPFFQLENEPTMTAQEHVRLLERNHKRVAPAPSPMRPAEETPRSAQPASPTPIPREETASNPRGKPDSPETGATW
jgi:hypothetical protein